MDCLTYVNDESATRLGLHLRLEMSHRARYLVVEILKRL